MCLAVPGKILSIVPGLGESTGRVATVDFQGSRMETSLALVSDAQIGDWILVHAGFALTVLDEEEAKETWETLRMALGEDVELPGAPPVGGGDA